MSIIYDESIICECGNLAWSSCVNLNMTSLRKKFSDRFILLVKKILVVYKGILILFFFCVCVYYIVFC